MRGVSLLHPTVRRATVAISLPKTRGLAFNRVMLHQAPSGCRSFHTSRILCAQKTDYYELLGVKKDADAKDIKKAFHVAAKKYHPDLNPGDKAAADKFAQISAAYDTLSDKDKRQKYDMFGHDAEQMGEGGNPFGGMGGMNAEDLFSELFGGAMGGAFGGRKPGKPRPSRGNDIQTNLRLSFMDAVKGCKRTVKVRTKDSCEPCNGSGAKPGTEKKCQTCRGQGVINQSQGPFTIQMPCNACSGNGQKYDDCATCRGSGFKSDVRDVEVTIPAGVDSESNVRLKEQGDAGKLGGPRGHLFIQITVDQDPRFRREGQDVHVNVPISFVTASLGGKVSVPTLEDEVILKVDPGTQPGDTRRMRGKGIKHVTGKSIGDQYVHFSVVVPKSLSPEAKKLLEQLGQELPSTDGGLSAGENYGTEATGFFSKVKGWMDKKNDNS
jgi:molecular chaperone DnaJ